MKKILLLGAFLMFFSGAYSQDTAVPTAGDQASAQVAPSVSPTPWIINKWNEAMVPWDIWFKKNTMVTDKTDYVHFFLNAQDFKANFEGKDKKIRLSEAALELVKRLYPADAKADLVKVDIVYVLERDSYGLPKWDSLQQVAHFEFAKSKGLKLIGKKSHLTEALLSKAFDKLVIY